MDACMLSQDNELVIVMEWAEAGDLAGLLRKQLSLGVPFTPYQVWAMFLQVGCIHRGDAA
jgi:NIMA (never in mitosis gene a)-related kinase